MSRPRLPPGVSFLIGLLFLLVLHPVAAVFQDEAYNVDFAHALFGTPIRANTFFHRPDSASKATLLYTLGEKGVVGAINPKDGEIVWRALVSDTVPARKEHGKGILRAHESSTTVVSAFGSTVRAWDAKDGRLIWEWFAAGSVKSIQIFGLEAGQCDVAVLTESAAKSAASLYRLSGNNGQVQWSYEASKGDVPVGVSISGSVLYLVSLNPPSKGGHKVKVQTVDASNGQERSQYTISSENDITSEASILHISGNTAAPVLVWTDDKQKNVHFNVLGNKQTTMAMINPYGTDVFTGIRVVEPASVDAAPHFLVHYDRENNQLVEVFHIDLKAGKANKAHDLPRNTGLATYSAVAMNAKVFFVEHTNSDTRVFTSLSSMAAESYPVRRKGSVAGSSSGSYAASELASRPDGTFSVRTAVVTGEGDWELYQNGEHTWIRYEGLAGISAAAFIDLPAPESLAETLSAESHSNFISAYIHRTTRHIKDLRYLPSWLQSLPTRLVGSLTGISLGESTNPVEYDSYGFKKIIVVATDKGRVAALGSANQGQVLWSWQSSKLKTEEPWKVQRIDVQGANLHVLAADGELLILDSITGRVVQHTPSTQGVSYYVPITGPDGKGSLLGVSQDGTPGILPDGFPTSVRIVTQRADGTVAGWKPMTNGKTSLVWNFVAKPGEKVLTVVTRAPHDPVASIGRARGDRNVLYKYLSRNLALVTASNDAIASLSVYLLDSISGQVLYTATHDNVDLSITIPAVLTENWLAYSIFADVPRDLPAESSVPSSSVKSYQLVVSELFESQIPNDRGPLGSAQNYSSLSEMYLPHVESAAFVVHSQLATLSTTSTLQGITPRALLAYSPMLAALVAVPVSLLSPRRPVGRDATQSEREEMLMRYQAHLDLIPQWYLSHERELLGIKNVISSPTRMESSSLVFAYGDIDLFGTRVSPIGTFDILGKGFSKLQLVLTVVALAAGTSFLAPMARKKGIDTLWKA